MYEGRDGDVMLVDAGVLDLDAPVPEARALSALQDIGVTRATLYAPSTGTEEVLRFLDDVAPLIDATKVTPRP